MYFYPVCHGNITGTFQVAVKMEKIMSVLMFKNCLWENFLSAQLGEKLFKVHIARNELFTDLSFCFQSPWQRGLSKQWPRTGYTQLCSCWISSQVMIEEWAKPPGLTRGWAVQLYSSLCTGNLFSTTHWDCMGSGIIISWLSLASDQEKVVMILLLMLAAVLFSAERIWFLKSNIVYDVHSFPCLHIFYYCKI